MPIDAVFLESLRCELQEQLLACRVDKVQQPERDTILLSMRGPNGGGKLLLEAVLEDFDGPLRFQQVQFAVVIFGADVFHGRLSFFEHLPRQAREYGQLSHALCPFVKINARKRRTSIHAAAKMTAKAAM